MKIKSVDNLVFFGMVLLLVYQNTLLYLSVLDGQVGNVVVITGAFILGLLLGRTTYIILGSILSFVCASAGALMLVLPMTREPYLWSALALVTLTPLTTYLMYLPDHRLLKRKALREQLQQLQQEKPDLEAVTGALNRRALEKAVERELELARFHEPDYQFALTLVKIDFLESVINFLGHERFNELLQVTARQLTSGLSSVDRLFYIGAGTFVVLSPMLEAPDLPVMKRRVKDHIDDIGEDFGLARRALVLRVGQVASLEAQATAHSVASVLALLERSAETDIVKEYF
ncbi:diguanylate cyclase domain-containing protein [Levilactobacillus spicheri]